MTSLVNHSLDRAPAWQRLRWAGLVSLALGACHGAGAAHAATALVPPAAVPAPVATAKAVDGTVYAVRADGSWRILAEKSPLLVGETLHTSRNSTINLLFTDGGQTLVRPDSSVQVQAYHFDESAPAQDQLALQLLRGGLRAITGRIGKRGDPNAYGLRVADAQVQVRGTDYTVRLCERACAEETASSATAPARPNLPQVVAGRVVGLQGQVFAIRQEARVPLSEGAPVYPKDILESTAGSHAVVVFRDNSRITLNPQSQLVVSQFLFNAAAPQQGAMAVNLIKGGLRSATGSIGKAVPQNVRHSTVTATVGIRGTQFDMVCGPADAGADPSAQQSEGQNCDGALYVLTRDGAVGLRALQGPEVLLSAGLSGWVPGAAQPAVTLPSPPALFQRLNTPLPEAVPVNLEQTFGVSVSAPGEAAPAGVYLAVREGEVLLSQASQEVRLLEGESAYAGLGPQLTPVRLESPPPVLNRDPFMADRMLNFNMCRR